MSLDKRSAQRFCPQCSHLATSSEPFGSTSIDVCGQCLGVWLDDGELQQIVAEFGNRFRLDDSALARARQLLQFNSSLGDDVPQSESQRASAIICPVCRGICFPTIYGFESGVIINRCGQGHGVFLDPGELEAILLYSARLLRGTEDIDRSLPALPSPGLMRRSAMAGSPQGSGNFQTARPPSGPHEGVRKATEIIGTGSGYAPALSSASKLDHEAVPRPQPQLRTTRALQNPVPIDVRVTISRGGALFFEGVRSPQGHWYPVKKGGTVLLPPNNAAPQPHYWVELDNGGALVVRQQGFVFEWILVGASAQPAVDLTKSAQMKAEQFLRESQERGPADRESSPQGSRGR